MWTIRFFIVPHPYSHIFSLAIFVSIVSTTASIILPLHFDVSVSSVERNNIDYPVWMVVNYLPTSVRQKRVLHPSSHALMFSLCFFMESSTTSKAPPLMAFFLLLSICLWLNMLDFLCYLLSVAMLRRVWNPCSHMLDFSLYVFIAFSMALIPPSCAINFLLWAANGWEMNNVNVILNYLPQLFASSSSMWHPK